MKLLTWRVPVGLEGAGARLQKSTGIIPSSSSLRPLLFLPTATPLPQRQAWPAKPSSFLSADSLLSWSTCTAQLQLGSSFLLRDPWALHVSATSVLRRLVLFLSLALPFLVRSLVLGKSWDRQPDRERARPGEPRKRPSLRRAPPRPRPSFRSGRRALTWLEGGGAHGVDARRQVSAVGGVRGRRGSCARSRSPGCGPSGARCRGAGPGPTGGEGWGGKTPGPRCAGSWKLGRLWTSWHIGSFSPKC